ncbi:hypothetical protein TEQG_08060 [Trichophyton equinum CBS 127.97]|uniref:Uncharacterized protein n=1 Tax=Trichophyton equinum (strain ATCC MYA-4606 / CBS 127.97) TaxID=559882 RepID=F2Q4Q9_TRIEC|nr:hypothetical protein TEQG_08060 [Trichophyton equinum CBS 127.97]
MGPTSYENQKTNKGQCLLVNEETTTVLTPEIHRTGSWLRHSFKVAPQTKTYLGYWISPRTCVTGGPIVYHLGWQWTQRLIVIVNRIQLLGFTIIYADGSTGLETYAPPEDYSWLDTRSLIELVLLVQSPYLVLTTIEYGVTFYNRVSRSSIALWLQRDCSGVLLLWAFSRRAAGRAVGRPGGD